MFVQPLLQRSFHIHCNRSPCHASNTYSEFVIVALGIQHAMFMRLIVICGLSGCTIFFHIVSQTVRFWGEKKVIERKICFDFLYKFGLKYFSF